MPCIEPTAPEPTSAGPVEGRDRLLALQRLTETLSRTTSEEAVFSSALDVLQDCLDLPKAAILLANAAGRMRFRAWRGLSDAYREADDGHSPWPIGDPSPEPVFVEDIQQATSLAHLWPMICSEGIRGLAFIPLLHQGVLLGEFRLYSAEPRRFTLEETRLCAMVSSLVGLATAQARRKQAMVNAVTFTERVIDTANVMVIGLDGDGRVVIFNGQAEQITGYRKGDVLGRSWFRIMVPRSRFPEVRDLLREYEASGVLPRSTEMPLLTKTGEERLVSWRNSVLREPGIKVAMLSFGIDITEPRRALEALRASEEKFSKIFQLSPDAIDLTRVADGLSLELNPSYAKLYGYSPEEILGHSTLPHDLGIWVDAGDRERHISELEKHGEVFGFEVLLRRKDGRTFIGSISSSVLEINGERCNLSLTRDITAQKKAEEALRASEEKFAKTFRLSPDAININRLEDGVYIDINQGFTDITGFTPEEVIGRSSLPGDLSVWVHQEDRERLVSALRVKGEMTGLEAQFRRKDGTIITGMMSARVLEIGGESCIVSVTRDITERKRMEEALLETTQRLRLAMASGNLGIWDWDLERDTELWNDRMYELYGLDQSIQPPTYEGWIRTVLHPEDTLRIPPAIRSAVEGQQPYDLEFRIIRPDGTVRHIKSNAVVVRDAQDRAVRVIGINRDRTEQVEAEAERRRLQMELHHAEKLESLGSLAGGVAHDMNNVLAAILVAAEVLRGRCADGDPMAKSLDIIQHAGHRGRDLVKALTDFARKGLEETSQVDLNEILRKEVELLRHTTLQKIQVILDLDEHLPRIPGAPSELGSAIMNLSVNAVDAMPSGGILAFRSRSLPDGWVELTVTDTGQGMSSSVLKKAMEPFFTTKPAGKGTGLGLARVYGTVRAHGGTVDLQSEPGKGTTVTLRLPSQSANPSKPDLSRGAGTERTGGKRILVVDDEAIILDTLPALLESIGHAAETACLGEEALRRLDAGQDFDLVILDHNMPGLTGVETLIQLRAKHPRLPVVLSTGFLDVNTEDLLASIPQVWVLKKPYGVNQLRKVLAEVEKSAIGADN